jgi:putative tryptophan/tyrosine transport system permease protein
MLNLYQTLGAVQLGLIFGLVVIGVYLSFRILNFPDLTVDGSFPLGGAVVAVMIMNGYNPWLGILVAAGAGFCAGVVTAWFNVRWNILHLLAGILTMTALYSINLRIMGVPNISLYGETTVFTPIENLPVSSMFIMPVAMLILTGIGLLIVYFYLKSESGLAMRATGANPRMARAQGINDKRLIILGMGLSNALVAIGGAFYAQMHGSADVNIGLGKVIEGLAAVILGEALLHTRKIFWALIACIVGSIFYRLAVAFAINADYIGLQSSDLNLVTALVVALAMIFPVWRKRLKRWFGREKAK